jgi:hypothetical protein
MGLDAPDPFIFIASLPRAFRRKALARFALTVGVAWRMNEPAEQRQLVCDAIVAYLLKHPAGSDTAEGICRWWLRPKEGEEDMATVEEALEELVRTGVMQRRLLPDGGVVYLAARGTGK